MEKLNELEMLSKFADKEVTWSLLPFDLSKEGWCVEVVDYIAAASPATILAIAESFRALEKEVQKNLEGALAWQQRAEAAEAKLAELEKQEPAAFTSPFYWSELNASGRVNCWLRNNRIDPDFSVELFTRPAPAINLAELVPDEDEVERIYSIYCTPTLGSKNALRHIRKEILRKIEEANK